MEKPEQYSSSVGHSGHVSNAGHSSQLSSEHIVKIAAGCAAALLIIGLSFYSGVQYQKNHTKNGGPMMVQGQMGTAFGGGFGGRTGLGQRPVVGKVTAVSSSSITVEDSRTGVTSTLAITSNTKITNDGQSSSADSIKTGDTVAVVADSSDAKQAARILINPSFGGRTGGQAPSTTSETQ